MKKCLRCGDNVIETDPGYFECTYCSSKFIRIFENKKEYNILMET
ncbi:MAG: hypothetical protein ACTSQG_00260 [Promethearchaeota archaeon]